MYVAVRQDRSTDPVRRDELAHRIGLGVLPLLAESPGFVAGYVVALDEGTVACLLFWVGRDGAAAGADLVASWIRLHVAELVDGRPEVGIGEVRSVEVASFRPPGTVGAPRRGAQAHEEEHDMVQTTTTSETATTQPAGRPGARVGTVAELTLIAPFKPGGAAQLREVLRRTAPELAAAADRVGTLHDMRWVIIDDDTRVLFATTYDGDWDAYIDDFATKLGEPLDTHFAMVEGYPGVASPRIKDWIARHQVTAEGWFCAYPDATVRQIWKGQKVLQAFEALLDTASS